MRGTCTYRGCDRMLYARGLCQMHYERQRLGIDMDRPPAFRNKGHVCRVDGCGRPACSHGLCREHDRTNRYGHYGKVGHDGDGLLVCAECGRSFKNLAAHVNAAHGGTDAYRIRHGLIHQERLEL